MVTDQDNQNGVDNQQVVEENPQLEQLAFSKEKLEKIKADLKKIIDVMADNPSLFSRAAKYWGEMALWKKIAACILITVPTLVIGLLFGIGTLIAISIISLFVYVAASVILDNHHLHSINAPEQLTLGINSLADLLGEVILALEKLHQQFKDHLFELNTQNEKLSANVTDFETQIADFTQKIQQLTNTAASVEEMNSKLQGISDDLTTKLAEQAKQLEDSQSLLAKTQQEYNDTKNHLSTEVESLKQTKEGLNAKLEQLDGIIKTLSGTVKDLAGSNYSEEEQAEFSRRLDEFVRNGTLSFAAVASRIHESEEALHVLTKQYKELNETYKTLLQEHKRIAIAQGAQLNQVGNMLSQAAHAQNPHGFYHPAKPMDIAFDFNAANTPH